MPLFQCIMPNPLKGYSFEQTMFAIDACKQSSQGRFTHAVSSSGTAFQFPEFNETGQISIRPTSTAMPTPAYMCEAGWFVFEAYWRRNEQEWQDELLRILQDISKNLGVDYYEPNFDSATPREHTVPLLELHGLHLGCSGGGHYISGHEREAAADCVDEPPADADVYTYIPSSLAVGTVPELFAEIIKDYPEDLSKLHGVVGFDGMMYSVDYAPIVSTFSMADDQPNDIIATLPLDARSRPHMWFVFKGRPADCLPLYQIIYTALRARSEHLDSPAPTHSWSFHEPERARYKCYRTSDDTHFYIPTSAVTYSLRLLLLQPTHETVEVRTYTAGCEEVD